MPKKFKSPHRVETVSPHVFLWGDGTVSYFQDDVVHATVEEAYAHWRTCRREVWAEAGRWRIPKGAMAHDGLRNEGIELLTSYWDRADFPLEEILRALAADREAVAAFRRDDIRGAQDVDDYLEIFLRDIEVREDLAHRLAAGTGVDRRELYAA